MLTTFDGLAPVTGTLVPVSVLSGGVSAVLRERVAGPGGRRQTPGPCRGRRTLVAGALVDMSLVFSALFAAYLVFSPQPESAEHLRLHLGNDLWTALRAAPGDLHPWVQLIGNLLLLFPLGALLPLRLGWFDSLTRVAVTALFAAVLVEAVQFLVVRGRVVSTDDVVLNTVGATAGAVIGRGSRRHEPAGAGSGRVGSARCGPQHSATEDGLYPVWWLIDQVQQERTNRVQQERTNRDTPSRNPDPALAGPRTRSGLQ